MTFRAFGAANGDNPPAVPYRFAPFALLTVLPACDPFDAGPPDPVPPNPAVDLRVRQEPSDTVRAGQTVRFTAVFSDSLKGYGISWHLGQSVSLTGRSVEWRVPDQAGTYYNAVRVEAGVTRGATSLIFKTHVVP